MEENAFGLPFDWPFALEQGAEGVSFEFVFEFGRDFDSGKVTEGRERRRGGRSGCPGPWVSTFRASAKRRTPGFRLPKPNTWVRADSRVVDAEPFGHAVVIDHDHDCVFVPSRFPEEVHQAPEVVIDVLDHGQVGRMGFVQTGVAEGLDELFRGGEGCVGRIGCQVAEKRLIFALVDKGHGFVKEDAFPVAFGFHAFAVADEEGVKVVVGTAGIGRAPVEPTLFGAGFVTQVPFPDEARLVPRGFQKLGKKNRTSRNSCRGTIVWVTPLRNSCMPVRRAARVGEQEGLT